MRVEKLDLCLSQREGGGPQLGHLDRCGASGDDGRAQGGSYVVDKGSSGESYVLRTPWVASNRTRGTNSRFVRTTTNLSQE